MKKTALLLLIILSIGVMTQSFFCEGNPIAAEEAWSSFVACVFFGDCDPFYFSFYESNQFLFVSDSPNKGSGILGSWRYDDSLNQEYVIITFEANNKFSLAEYKISDAKLIHRNKGIYSTEKEQLQIKFQNGISAYFSYSVNAQGLYLNKNYASPVTN